MIQHFTFDVAIESGLFKDGDEVIDEFARGYLDNEWIATILDTEIGELQVNNG